MKKILLLPVVLIFSFSLITAAEQKPAPMKVVVEGEEEARAAKEAPVVIIKHTPEKRITAADLKALASKSELENEIMDAVISKVSDLEEEVKKQKLFDALVLGAYILLFGMVYFTRRKK